MSRRAARVLLLMSLLLPSSAVAQEPQPKDALLKEVTAGFDGIIDRHAPTPVWVTLENQKGHPLELRLVARSGSAMLEERIVLPPGARRRIGLGLVVDKQLLVEVFEGGTRLEHRLLDKLSALDSRRHLLVLDGRPKGKREGRVARRSDAVLAVTSIDASIAPVEPSCYRPFGAILLRGVDPDAWSQDQLDSLLEFVGGGGTVLVGDVSPGRPGPGASLLTRVEGAVHRAKLLGRPVRVHSLGLGSLIAFPDDVLAASQRSDPKSAKLRQDLGDLVSEMRDGNTSPRLFQEFGGSFVERPGVGTQATVIGFFALYLLVVGPCLGFFLRKASRRRLALATVITIGSFALLAPLVAIMVRTGAGVVHVHEVFYVPASSTPVHIADVKVVSGGAIHYDAKIVAPSRKHAATLLPVGTQRTQVWNGQRWDLAQARPLSVRTSRGREVQVGVDMGPWDYQSLAVTTTPGPVKPLDAILRRTAEGFLVTVTNTTGVRLVRAIVLAEGLHPDESTPFVELGDLDPGEQKAVRIVRSGNPAKRSRFRGELERPTCFKSLDLPQSWETWNAIVPQRGERDTIALRYNVVSRMEPLLSVSGDNLEVKHHAVRIDPIRAGEGLQRGYLGIVLEEGSRYIDGNGMEHAEVRIRRVVPGSPAATSAVPEGAVVYQVDQTQVISRRHMRKLVSRHLPGETITLQLWDLQAGSNRNIKVTLGPREVVPVGD